MLTSTSKTGSLISIQKNVRDIVIPSEERKLNMYPMDYEEFLWATGDNASYNIIKKFYETGKPLGQQTNRKLLRDFRLYMLVGGMPQAVEEYIKSNNFKKVDLVKRDILHLYEEDFVKIDPTGRATMLFDAIPAQLKKNASRYQVSSVLKKTDRAGELLELISEMKDSKTANLGYLYENIVAQMLTACGNELFYHTFMNRSSRHNYEVDFLIARKNKICPLEIKSSGYKKHASLDHFCEKFSNRILNILANAISCRLRLSKCTEIAFASLVYRQRKSLTSINSRFEYK